MPMRRSPSASTIDKLVWALCVNAVLLGLILLVLVFKDSQPSVLAAPAWGQAGGAEAAMAPAGSGPLIMPGQLSPNAWGCYLLDNQRQTLCVYEYLHNEGLRLVAARDVRYDPLLKNFNTAPSPVEIEALGKQPQGTPRVLQSAPAGDAPRGQ